MAADILSIRAPTPRTDRAAGIGIGLLAAGSLAWGFSTQFDPTAWSSGPPTPAATVVVGPITTPSPVPPTPVDVAEAEAPEARPAPAAAVAEEAIAVQDTAAPADVLASAQPAPPPLEAAVTAAAVPALQIPQAGPAPEAAVAAPVSSPPAGLPAPQQP